MTGQVRREFVFDARNRDGWDRYDLAPGTWRFEGQYGGAWAAAPPKVSIPP